RIPMVLVERGGDATTDRPVFIEVIGFHNSSLIRLLQLETQAAAFAVAGAAITVRDVPQLGAACTPNQLANVGRTSTQTTYTTNGHECIEGAPVEQRLRLVEQPKR